MALSEKSEFLPKWIAWETTQRCNLNCIHCRCSSDESAPFGSFTTQRALALIDDIASYVRPVMVLSGGEPLVRDDIFEIAAHGTAKGFPHDDCKADQPGGCGCLHSELNSLIKVRVNDPRKVVFVTAQPCVMCAKAIINSGASKIYYRAAYRSDEGLDLFKKAGIEIERV